MTATELMESRARALALLQAEDERNDKIHALLETIREQIRVGIAPEHRPEGLMTNIQTVVYAMRGRMRLMNDAAVTSPLQPPSAALTSPREVLERATRDMGLFGHGVMVVHGASAEHLPFERIGFAEPLSDTRAAQWARLRAFLDEVRA